ncbi:class II fructose-bisphosphatase [Bacillus sp. V5-8f]|uniref:class II fructose-bisphosphatase n=1 Tax=Bacillus sp. V5-8f TaxID=2053044 RepID=UPI000C76B2F9|nr:class II fructose-bisphosphatase [Bacillus sp. V5-8f]PLT33725.1 fructose-bisphosphatase class II [Bacillus sp. V5-8f]
MEVTTSAESSIHHLVLDFLRVSQSAALAAYPWIGKSNKTMADDAGTMAMRKQLNLINMSGTIVIGEGEMDDAPMLHIGEKIGTGNGPLIDIAVDPIEGTSLLSTGQDNSLAVIAVAAGGSLLHAPDMYMTKLAVGPKAKDCINIDISLTENMKIVAEKLGKEVSELTVMVQDRPRHHRLMKEVMALNATIKLFSDVDITGAIGTAIDESGVDLFVGTGGAPEGVIAATALKCLGGDFQAKLVPQNSAEIERCKRMGINDLDRKFTINDIIKTNDCFFIATGITDGMLLKGVQKKNNGSKLTHSLVVTGKNHVYQFIEAHHK